jgi:iron complex outermembrane receptor protein
MNSRKALWLAIAAANLASFTQAAYSAPTIEEVVVTATKRSENLQEVPLAISAYTEKAIANAGIERPQDFIALTPNVTMVQSANAGDSQVTIRGIVSTRDAEGTFAYVVDGVLVTNPNSFNQELFDIKQIEVLKGPQGALYGRNAVAGAILVTTKEPGDKVEGKLKAGFGTENLKKFGGDISGPITDKIKAGIAFNSREDDGQYENEYTGKDDDVDYIEDRSMRARAIIDVTDVWRLDTQFGYRKVEGGAINFNAVFALPTAAEFLNVPELNKDVNDHEFRFINNVPGENDQKNQTFSIKSDYEMDFAKLTTVLAYDNLEENLLSDGTSAAFGGYSLGAPQSASTCLDSYNSVPDNLLNGVPPFYAIKDGNPPGSYIPAGGLGPGSSQTLNALLPPYSPTTCDGYQYQERNQESYSIEMRLTSKEDGPVQWIAGIYAAQIDREVVVAYGADFGLGFEKDPYVPPTGRNPTDLLFWDDFDTDVYSTFGQIDWDFVTDQTLTFALRWDQERRKVSNKVPDTTSAQIFGALGPQGTINPAFNLYPGDIPDRNETFNQFQPKVTWSWIANDNINTYASYGVGFRSGGFNSLGSEATVESNFGSFDTAPQNIRDEYDKEISKAFEVGVKSEWLDRTLRLNASAFHTEVEDNQFFNFFAGSFGLLRVVTNIDEVEINGLEIDGQYLLTEEFSVDASYGVINSEIKKNRNRPYTEGNDAPLAPETTANIGLQYAKEIRSGLELVARIDWRYVGDTWFSEVQDDTTTNGFTDLMPLYGGLGATAPFGFGQSNFKNAQRDAFDVVNARLSLEGEHWKITAWGENIFDEEYVEEIIPAPEFGGSFIHPSKGEAYGVDISYKF